MFCNEIMSCVPQFRSGVAVETVQFFARFRCIDTDAPAYLGGNKVMVDDGEAESESEGFLVIRLTQSMLLAALARTLYKNEEQQMLALPIVHAFVVGGQAQ